MPDSGIALAPNGTAWHRAGTGPALVLIHGVGLSGAVWGPQVADFARDHSVVTYDMLGHGNSALPPEHPRLADYAAQLATLLDHLGIARAAIVGHSMGALVALEFALSHPERVSRLVALNAVYCRTPEQRAAVEARAAALDGAGPAVAVAGAVARWFGDPVPEAMRPAAAQVSRMLTETNPLGYARSYGVFATSDRAHATALPRLAVPALFLTGEFDPNSTPSMSRAMAAAAPRGVAEILAGERHMMALLNPTLVNARLRAFLDAEG